MPIVSCQQCSNKFYVKPNRLLRGWGRFCSNECKHEGFKTGSILACSVCSKPVYKSLKDQKGSDSGKFFCGKSCQAKWRNLIYTEERHANWKGGESSYKAIMRRTNLPIECAKCKTVDSRVMAVHHKDRNRNNNALSNLVWLCHNCHFLVHHYKDEMSGFLVPVA
jgi:hypothetical protein